MLKKAGRRRSRRRRPVRTFLFAMTACIMVLVVTLASVALYLQHELSSRIDRVDGAFAGLANRPAKPAGQAADAVNILLLGTDRRSDQPTTGERATTASWLPGAQRSDAIMMLHIDADRRGASVISIPRDSWVMVPGRGPQKINAAFSFGGPSLAIETIERLTDVRIDHLAVIDWSGFEDLTDEIGGVTLDIPETVHDGYRDITWSAGRHRLDGEDALDYVGQRAGLPGGDFDRIHRQQYFLRTLLNETLRQELIKDPVQVYRILGILTDHLSIDSGWSVGEMRSLLISLRSLRSADIQYLTVPVSGTGMEGVQSVVHLDTFGGDELWSALREDDISEWLSEHPDNGVPATVN